MTGLVISSPMRGWALALADVPDPAFSGGMIGDGAAVDPLDGRVCAPCDGTVSSVAKGSHAVTIRADNGAEVLVHVGIDTVAANGTGLTLRVETGQHVRSGDLLIDVALDELLDHARSLVSPVVVVNAADFSLGNRRQPGPVESGAPLFELTPLPSRASNETTAPSRVDASEEVPVSLPHGVHARPAAEIVRLSRRFSSQITLVVHGRRAQSRSMTALMSLGAAHGDRVRIEAGGEDARDAVRAVASILATTSVEPVETAPADHQAPAAAGEDRLSAAGKDGELAGIVASPGLAIGRARHLRRASVQVEEQGESVEQESEALSAAIREAAAGLRSQASGGNDILAAQLELLEDPALADTAGAAIRRGKSAGFAWREAVSSVRETFAATHDPRIAERVADLRDIEEQVLVLLAGVESVPAELPAETILLADDLLPSQFGRLDLDRVAGICCAGGGPTSHTALMAAARGIPAVVGLGRALLAIEDGTRLLLDAERGVLVADPGEASVDEARAAIAAGRSARAVNLREAAREAVTADGVRVEVLANLGSETEAREAVRLGAEGCGLLRTELLYLDRRTAPGEDEQAALYQAIAHILGDRPLVIRTLDVGGDKPLPYLPLPAEENPLLGLRGLRASLRYPSVLETQLRAITRVEPQSQCRILLPMVTEPEEIRSVRRMLESLRTERGQRLPEQFSLGAMIETPASVALADAIAREADFLSIGSNDLAQYTLAMDRTNPFLAHRFDYLHPAVLRQIAAVCAAGRKASRSVSVCGALASEPVAVPVLVGLGVRTLSMVPSVVPALKALVRRLTVRDCERLAAKVLAQDDAASARRVAEAFEPTSLYGAAS